MFATGRFLAALAQLFLKPRWILLLSYTGMLLFTILSTKFTGAPALTMILLIYLFQSGAYSIIFAIALRGTARHTKTAAVLLTVAVSGGGVFTFAQHAARINMLGGVFDSYCVLVALYAGGAVFPVYLNVWGVVKKQVDPVPGEYLRRHGRRKPRSRSSTSPNNIANTTNNSSNSGNNNDEGIENTDFVNLTRVHTRNSEKWAPSPRGQSAFPEQSSRSDSCPDYGNEGGGYGGGGIMHEPAPWPNT